MACSRAFIPIALSLLSSLPAFAAGHVQDGKMLAEQRCTNCHIVQKAAPNAIESQPVGPDFMAMKGMTAAKLKARLKSGHPVMSKFPDLTEQQVSDLAAYITSVAK